MNQSSKSVHELRAMAHRMRKTALDLAFHEERLGRSAHLGGSLSCIEIYAVLYGEVLRYDASNPQWEERDRFIAGKEHARLAEYPAMVEAGLLDEALMYAYEEDASSLAGHPRNPALHLEYSSCSLGMALPFAVGAAYELKSENNPARVYTLVGDGECHEGSVWEAVMFAAQNSLDNLTLILDRNHLCVDGITEAVMDVQDFPGVFRAFGWHVVTVDGHNIEQLLHGFAERTEAKPTAVIAETVKGKGFSFMEHQKEWHYSRLSEQLYMQACQEWEGAAEHGG